MFIWAVEPGQALTFDRRATQVASSTADHVRAAKQIAHTEIGDIMKVGGYILEPYSQTPLEIAAGQRHLFPRPRNHHKAILVVHLQGSGQNPNLATAPTPIKNIPPNLLTSNDSGVVAEVAYGYKPLIFDYFMKRAAGAATSGTGVYTLTGTNYLKPRSQAAICSRTPPLARCRAGEGTRAQLAPRLGCRIFGGAVQARRPQRARTIPGCICPKRPFPPMLVDPAVRQAPRHGKARARRPWDDGRRTRRSSCAN